MSFLFLTSSIRSSFTKVASRTGSFKHAIAYGRKFTPNTNCLKKSWINFCFIATGGNATLKGLTEAQNKDIQKKISIIPHAVVTGAIEGMAFGITAPFSIPIFLYSVLRDELTK